MGNAYSYALEQIEREFVRVQHLPRGTDARRFIRYDELLQVVIADDLRVDLSHVAVLFALDRNRDGVFSYDDMLNFLQWVSLTVPDTEHNQFAEAVQARCVLRMWQECVSGGKKEGNTIFVEWMCLLLRRNIAEGGAARSPSCTPLNAMASLSGEEQEESSAQSPLKKSFDSPDSDSELSDESEEAPKPSARPDVVFGLQELQTAYGLLKVADGYGLTFPMFCQILAQATEEGMTSSAQPQGTLEAASQSVCVPESSLRTFLHSFIDSYWRVLSNLGLDVLL